jgi:hypothetical protein
MEQEDRAATATASAPRALQQERAPGAPILSALWAAAANAAHRHGVSRTTRALGPDYNKLKLRVLEGAPVEPA